MQTSDAQPASDPPDATRSPLTIDVVSDVVCPWCWIGKGQLDDAVSRWRERHPGQPGPRIRWRPFQLNPDLPDSGLPRGEYLDAKFGSRTAYPAQRLARAAEQAGVPMRLDAIARQPNTLRAHALLEAAGRIGDGGVAGATDGAGRSDSNDALQQTVADALFRAYFAEGRDIGDEAVLRELGLRAGLPADRIDAALGEQALDAARAADAQARRAGIQGVPFFIVNGRVAVSGAQGADALLAAIEQACNVRA